MGGAESAGGLCLPTKNSQKTFSERVIPEILEDGGKRTKLHTKILKSRWKGLLLRWSVQAFDIGILRRLPSLSRP
ncbi:hypothetical protein IF2G_08890 [Cordyceps javanica]|nr:hypothetical protein IF2G_08890 [Cordyceps javanica]